MLKKSLQIFIILFGALFLNDNSIAQYIQLEDSTCKRTQLVINKMAHAIYYYPSNESTFNKEVGFRPIVIPELLHREELLESNKISKKYYEALKNLSSFINIWGDIVMWFHGAKNYGSLKMNQKKYFALIRDYEKWQLHTKRLCPDVTFPEFSFWNSVIEKQ